MANRYWVGGNANWDATAGTKWALSSGGAGGQAVPTSSDAVFLDNGTGNGNVTVTYGAAALSVNCTGYVHTLTINSGGSISVSGAVTLASGMTAAGDGVGYVFCLATATLTSGGISVPWLWAFGGTSQTFTMSGAWTVGSLSIQGTTAVTVNGSTISAGGMISGQPVTLSGTTVITLTGGTWSDAGGATYKNSITIAGNVTFSGTILYSTGTLTYSSGTISGTGTLTIPNSTTIVGGTWPNLEISAGLTLTINGAITVTGTLTLPDSNVTFAGTAGYTVGTWTNPTTVGVGATYTHTAGNVYTVTKFFNPITAGNAVSLVSSDGTNTFRFTLPPPASQNVPGITATRVDSTAGEAVYDPGGTLTTALNWYTTYPWGQFFCGG